MLYNGFLTPYRVPCNAGAAISTTAVVPPRDKNRKALQPAHRETPTHDSWVTRGILSSNLASLSGTRTEDKAVILPKKQCNHILGLCDNKAIGVLTGTVGAYPSNPKTAMYA